MDLQFLRQRGFLPKENPLQRLPPEFGPIEELQRIIPELFSTKHLRPYFEKNFPYLEIDFTRLNRPLATAIARNIFFAGSAYVRNHNEPVANYIPKNLAILMAKAGEYFQMSPILSYFFYCLNNWHFIDKEEDFNPENLRLIQTFIPDDCENWFIVIHVSIEHYAGAGLVALIEARQAIEKDDMRSAAQKLEITAASLRKVNEILRRMPERCRPEDYYHRVRPQIKYFSDVVYEGVEKFGGKPQSFRGETGAQSSIVPAMRRFLGIKHKQSSLTLHLNDMINYMTPEHRDFLKTEPRETESGSLIRDYLINKLPKDIWAQYQPWLWDCYHQGKKTRLLREAYNDCIRLIHEFRKIHRAYAISYIQEKTGDTTGTGGTPYVPWLTQMMDETLNFLI